MRIVSHKEMQEIEKKSFSQFHFNESLIIENVGIRGADYLQENYLKDFVGEIVVLVGAGSNGADGLSIARHLKKFDHSIRAFLMFPIKEFSKDLTIQLQLAESYGVKVSQYRNTDELESYLSHAPNTVVIDAIFGTGLRLPLPNFLYDVIKLVNDISSLTVAVDIPTGVMCDTGAVQGNAINAQVTLAIALPKIGHYVHNGAKFSGHVEVLEVGFPKELLLKGDKFLLTPALVSQYAKTRNKFSHKNNFGHTLLIGGSHGMTGALCMAALASLKVGTGLATAVTWEKYYPELAAKVSPEIMTGFIPNDESKWTPLIKDLDKYSSIVIGPGLGKSSKTRKIVLEILNNFNGPVILDADAINVLKIAEDSKIFSMRSAPVLLTPHFGEFSRFAGIGVEQLIERPIDYLRLMVEKLHCSVILKGSCSYLGFSSGDVSINYYPNDGMAKAGSGDVLAGVLGGLMAQVLLKKENRSLYDEYTLFDKTVALGVMVHTLSGFSAAKKFGVRSMTAMSLIDCMQDAFDILEKETPKEGKVNYK